MPFNGIDAGNEHAHASGLWDAAFGKIRGAQGSRRFKPDEAHSVGRMLKDVTTEIAEPRINDRSPAVVVVVVEGETTNRKGGPKRAHRKVEDQPVGAPVVSNKTSTARNAHSAG